jgi:hypothetical protein
MAKVRYFHPCGIKELQIDLDSKKALNHFRYALRILKTSKHITVIRSRVRPSFIRGHYHATVTIKEVLTMIERVALQLCLGDDPLRGLLNYGRVLNRDPYPIIFIESFPPSGYLFKDAQVCDCSNTKKLPRCKHLRNLQPSEAEFLPRGN